MAALTPILEALAIFLGLLYLLLAMREQRSAWIAGGAASGIFLFIFWRAAIPMQALLQLYYVAIAALAWRRWGRPDAGAALQISRCNRIYTLRILVLWLCLTLCTVALRSTPYNLDTWLDTTTSWGGVLATWMVAQKKLEAWIYWIIIDVASALLYLRVDLPASGALYLLYTVLAILAWRQWRASYLAKTAN